MFSSEMPTGHSAAHEPMLVQAPKPSLSIWATMFSTRVLRSTWPWGSSESCDTLADTNSIADAFLHAATHAPQPMQVAASKARSEISFGIGISLPSGAPPVFTLT